MNDPQEQVLGWSRQANELIERYRQLAFGYRQLKRLKIKLDYQPKTSALEVTNFNRVVDQLADEYTAWNSAYTAFIEAVKALGNDKVDPMLREHAGYSLNRVTNYAKAQGELWNFA
ncbi:hypothetical protein [Secundilactobacillus kimchicus]|uniref:Uncharacterized protein n=1 Tax=Secundilactobacillus kimchicus JCM 15530 TaxID=1302272 RepID=A0A0R1HXJ9_9LACO|nr:hypothetical protein [Secundilactobacillus kimchicus]KRK48138.1 hypothetical protein FC96_GL001870 [Secundilactobacillus kimchicus JCM 15530]